MSDLYAVKYPGFDWTLDPTGELRAADVVGMRVARLVELRDTPARVAANTAQTSQEGQGATLDASTISEAPPKVDPAENDAQGFATRLQESSMLAHMNDLRAQLTTARAEGWDAAMHAAAEMFNDHISKMITERGMDYAQWAREEVRALSGKCPPKVDACTADKCKTCHCDECREDVPCR